jgi:general secretion pathway protein G
MPFRRTTVPSPVPTGLPAKAEKDGNLSGLRMKQTSAPGRLNRQRAFTIVELMIVLLLVGVLAAIALPYYGRYQNKVRSAQVVTDLLAMSAVIEAYSLDARAFPPNLAAAGLANRLDPWGRPYAYYNVDANGRGHARKDHALNPINSDFDLYSMGPDGKTKPQITQKDSVDDIIRASNGKFIGIAADF